MFLNSAIFLLTVALTVCPHSFAAPAKTVVTGEAAERFVQYLRDADARGKTDPSGKETITITDFSCKAETNLAAWPRVTCKGDHLGSANGDDYIFSIMDNARGLYIQATLVGMMPKLQAETGQATLGSKEILCTILKEEDYRCEFSPNL